MRHRTHVELATDCRPPYGFDQVVPAGMGLSDLLRRVPHWRLVNRGLQNLGLIVQHNVQQGTVDFQVFHCNQ